MSTGSVAASGYTAWAPSAPLNLKTANLQPGETGNVQVTFTSQGDWQLDDVFIDPFRAG